MKFKIQKKTVIISGIVAVLCAAGVCTALFLTRDRSKALVGTYPEASLPDYKQFLPENAIHAFFDERGGCAYHTDAKIYYENGEYRNVDAAPCVSENGTLSITTEQYGTKSV